VTQEFLLYTTSTQGSANNTCQVELYNSLGELVDNKVVSFVTTNTEKVNQLDTAGDKGNSEYGE